MLLVLADLRKENKEGSIYQRLNTVGIQKPDVSGFRTVEVVKSSNGPNGFFLFQFVFQPYAKIPQSTIAFIFTLMMLLLAVATPLSIFAYLEINLNGCFEHIFYILNEN